MQICKCKVEEAEVIHRKKFNLKYLIKNQWLIGLAGNLSLIQLLKRFQDQTQSLLSHHMLLKSRINLSKVQESVLQSILQLVNHKLQAINSFSQLFSELHCLQDQSNKKPIVIDLVNLLHYQTLILKERNCPLNKNCSKTTKFSTFRRHFLAQELFQKVLRRKRSRIRSFLRKVLNTQFINSLILPKCTTLAIHEIMSFLQAHTALLVMISIIDNLQMKIEGIIKQTFTSHLQQPT